MFPRILTFREWIRPEYLNEIAHEVGTAIFLLGITRRRLAAGRGSVDTRHHWRCLEGLPESHSDDFRRKTIGPLVTSTDQPTTAAHREKPSVGAQRD